MAARLLFIALPNLSIVVADGSVQPLSKMKKADIIKMPALKAVDQPSDPALHEAGEIYHRVYGTLRTGDQLLLPFHIADPPLSGSADPPYHQGLSERTDEREKGRAL